MSASVRAQGTPRKKERKVHIYIDSSNLCIQGRETYAERHPSTASGDRVWRPDIDRLKELLVRETSAFRAGEKIDVKVNVYVSVPPPVDSIWGAIECPEVSVYKFERSQWTGREKEVDTEIVAASVEEALESHFKRILSEFVIVSGDRDFHCAVSRIAKWRSRVHVWSWKRAQAGVYRQQQKSHLIQVHLLDDSLEEIGSLEQIRSLEQIPFLPDLSEVTSNSIAILNAASRAGEVADAMWNLGVPVHGRAAVKQDHIFVPKLKMSISDQDIYFQRVQETMKKYSLAVLSYMEYPRRLHPKDQAKALTTHNRFSILEAADDGNSERGDSQKEDGDA